MTHTVLTDGLHAVINSSLLGAGKHNGISAQIDPTNGVLSRLRERSYTLKCNIAKMEVSMWAGQFWIKQIQLKKKKEL